jgi:hypothetical protein
MKYPDWALPLIAVMFVAVRILVAYRFGMAERERTGKSWFQSVPIWIRAFWAILVIAVVVMLVWHPRKSVSTSANPSTGPAPVASPAPSNQAPSHP